MCDIESAAPRNLVPLVVCLTVCCAVWRMNFTVDKFQTSLRVWNMNGSTKSPTFFMIGGRVGLPVRGVVRQTHYEVQKTIFFWSFLTNSSTHDQTKIQFIRILSWWWANVGWLNDVGTCAWRITLCSPYTVKLVWPSLTRPLGIWLSWLYNWQYVCGAHTVKLRHTWSNIPLNEPYRSF